MLEYISIYNCLEKYFTEKVLSNYPENHYFFKVSQDKQFASKYFAKLNEIFIRIELFLGAEACIDYAKKLISKSNHKFNASLFNQNFTELLVVFTMLDSIDTEDIRAKYEPKKDGSEKRTECKIWFDLITLNIEVKVLDCSNSFDPVLEDALKRDVYIFKENLPITNERKTSLRRSIMMHEKLDIGKMAQYKSEFRKINKRIKSANKKFNPKEKYNILFINYNEGLDPHEIVKCVLDGNEGVLHKNDNMKYIDAIVVLSLSQKSYTLTEVDHFKETAMILYNYKRGNSEVLNVLSSLGFTKHFPLTDVNIIPDHSMYVIVMFHDINQYAIVPHGTDMNELFKDVVWFNLSKEERNDEVASLLKELKVRQVTNPFKN